MKVVDIGVRPSTAWCSRLLADFGAEVIMVEPDGGHPLRAHPPFDDAGRSIPSRYFLANKASGSRDLRDTLIESADIIVASSLEGAAMARRNAAAIVCAITPHGQDGAYKDFPGNDLTAAARSGWAYVNGWRPVNFRGRQRSESDEQKSESHCPSTTCAPPERPPAVTPTATAPGIRTLPGVRTLSCVTPETSPGAGPA